MIVNRVRDCCGEIPYQSGVEEREKRVEPAASCSSTFYFSKLSIDRGSGAGRRAARARRRAGRDGRAPSAGPPLHTHHRHSRADCRATLGDATHAGK